jgi:aspartate racemase
VAQHIGIVACSAEGAALCYRTICSEAASRMGTHRHPEVSLHTLPLADYMVPIRAGDWDQVAEMMLTSTRKLASVGADFAICPDNTIHQAFDEVAARSPIPWLHIGDSVARAAASAGYGTLGITGTKYLMTGPVYPTILARHGMGCEIPGEAARERIDEIIFSQLVAGVFPEESRLYFNEVFQELKDRGCDAAVMGCTEIPLLVDPEDTPLPVLDSTRLLARAALDRALTGGSGR